MTQVSLMDDENLMYSLSLGWERVGVADDEIPPAGRSMRDQTALRERYLLINFPFDWVAWQRI